MNLTHSLFEIIKANASQKELNWIESKAAGNLQSIQTAFVATPRFVSKSLLNKDQPFGLKYFQNWTLDQLTRVYFLSKLEDLDEPAYSKTLNLLFETAENNEAVVLISSLIYLKNPKQWLLRATDAVRSNIGVVFDAIAFNNPYPKEYFSELAWNQLVLKCIFNDKPINKILGLDDRANKELAASISNLAHERWAAGRSIAPQAWRLVVNCVDEIILDDIKRLFDSEKIEDQLAAALICQNSDNPSAKLELRKHPDLEKKSRGLTWSDLES